MMIVLLENSELRYFVQAILLVRNCKVSESLFLAWTHLRQQGAITCGLMSRMCATPGLKLKPRCSPKGAGCWMRVQEPANIALTSPIAAMKLRIFASIRDPW